MADFDWAWPKRVDPDAVEAALRLRSVDDDGNAADNDGRERPMTQVASRSVATAASALDARGVGSVIGARSLPPDGHDVHGVRRSLASTRRRV